MGSLFKGVEAIGNQHRHHYCNWNQFFSAHGSPIEKVRKRQSIKISLRIHLSAFPTGRWTINVSKRVMKQESLSPVTLGHCSTWTCRFSNVLFVKLPMTGIYLKIEEVPYILKVADGADLKFTSHMITCRRAFLCASKTSLFLKWNRAGWWRRSPPP